MKAISPRLAALTMIIATIVAAAAYLGFGFAERYYLERTALQSQSTLRLVVAGLRGALRRYEPLPTLLADKADVKLLLLNPADAELEASLNRELKQIAANVGASDIYLMDATGLTLVASNFDSEKSFVGGNFSYRPYFQTAFKGEPAQYFAHGTTSLKRGYYFSAPVRSGGKVTGVVVVKINVAAFEADWSGGQNEIVVSDENGIIFMASRPDWRFKSLRPLTKEVLQDIEGSRQYPVKELGEIPTVFEQFGPEGPNLLTLRGEKQTESFVVGEMPMPKAGWNVKILTATAGATAQATAAIIISVLAVLLVALLAAFAFQRRARLVERIAAQHEAQAELEARVEERTADLNRVNTKLRQEIEERTAAERQLIKAQADLVQASKLAALGQMSAALSHEFNQPLAAIRTYADNAGAYLDRDRPEEARGNVDRILELTDSMAAISKHLRNFARKPQEKIGAVPLATVVNDAVEIMSGKLKHRSADVSIDLPPRELWVKGGQVRLQQVLVNLISNALDAAPDEQKPQIEIAAREVGERIHIDVRDHGPGFDAEVVNQIFDPFFTTKGISKGLGLGLSISYNIIRDFGGTLTAANHPQGGAVFTIELEASDGALSDAAE